MEVRQRPGRRSRRGKSSRMHVPILEHFQKRPAKPSLLRSTRPGAVDRMKVHVQMNRSTQRSSDEKLRSAVCQGKG
jgi:hypothetical protein